MSHSVTIRAARPGDAGPLAVLAEQLFRTAFGPTNDPVQIDRYCAASYGAALQAAEIARPMAITLLLEDAAGLQGFAQLLRDSRPPASVDVGPAPLEVQRFYVAPALHGEGVARLLMQRCQEEAVRAGCEVMWLGVWQNNPRAIAFYHKCGFKIAGEQIFMLGTETQFDYVMTCPLTREL